MNAQHCHVLVRQYQHRMWAVPLFCLVLCLPMYRYLVVVLVASRSMLQEDVHAKTSHK